MVESTALEMRRGRKLTVGSNPTLSAIYSSAQGRGGSQNIDIIRLSSVWSHCRVRPRSHASMNWHGTVHGIDLLIHGIGDWGA